MMPISPDELLLLLRSTSNGVGLPVNADNLAATAKLLVDRLVEIGRDESGILRVRLIGKHKTSHPGHAELTIGEVPIPPAVVRIYRPLAIEID
jgi:hypothetical protein